MQTFIKFSDITQYRNIIRTITDNVRYSGKDENGNPIFDTTASLPTLTFTGTVKLNGTNAGVSLCGEEMWAQSRTRIITKDDDNAGFARFVDEHKDAFYKLFNEIKDCITVRDDQVLTIFGEWCGGSIQEGVAINQLNKRFVIFAIKVSTKQDEEFDIWDGDYYPCDNIRDNDSDIYNILDYKTYSIDVDFSNPKLCQNKIVDFVNEVEKECPFAKEFGVSGIGEGIVWTTWYNDKCYSFKTKCEKHNVSKVKKIAAVDPEELKNINEFIEYAVTENRLRQGIEQTFSDNPIDIKKMGDFLKWVIRDIDKEESDVLEKNGLTMKQINKYANNKSRRWFMERLNNDF